VAHIFLLGVLMDFWNQWLPPLGRKKSKKAPPTGPCALYRLPADVVNAIAARAPHIMQTSLFKKVYTDITKCVTIVVGSLAGPILPLPTRGPLVAGHRRGTPSARVAQRKGLLQAPQSVAHGGLAGLY
jgi:hypothetical protein